MCYLYVNLYGLNTGRLVFNYTPEIWLLAENSAYIYKKEAIKKEVRAIKNRVYKFVILSQQTFWGSACVKFSCLGMWLQHKPVEKSYQGSQIAEKQTI